MERASRRTLLLVTLTAAAAAALAVAGLAALARSDALLLGVVVAAGIALLSLRTVRVFAYGELSLGDVVALAGAALLPVTAVAPLALAGALAAQLQLRRPRVQVLRNVAAFTVCAGGASLAYAAAMAVLPSGVAQRVAAALAAAVTFIVLDAVQTAALVASLEAVPAEQRRAHWLWRTARSQATWLFGGAIAVEVIRVEPLLVLPVAPLFLLGFEDARERYLAIRRARVLATLIDTSHAVGETLDTTAVFRALYQKVRDRLEADAFFVALARDENTLSYRYLVDAGSEMDPQERPRQGTLAGLAIDQDRPILLRDVAREHGALGLERQGWGSVSERSIMVAPLHIRGKAVGAISAQSVNPGAYDEGDLELLGAIANEAALAIERANLYERSAALSRRLFDLHRLGAEISAEREVAPVARRFCDAAKELLGSSAVALFLDNGGDALEFEYRAGPSKVEVPRLPRSLPLTARALRGEVIEVADSAMLPDESRGPLEASGHRAVMLQPLSAAGSVGGVAFATWTEPHTVTDEERELLGVLADLGASAIRRIKLYSELDEAYLSTVQTLMTTIQARDGYLQDHQTRVAADAVALGARLGLPDETLRDLRYASLFHSIGKIGVPQEILAKPDPLTDEERRIVHEHPLLGARILEGIRFLRGVVPIVRSANERWDGSGYPEGLAYEAIPYEARMLQIVLTYQAMIVDRPYRRAIAPRVALDEIRLLAGTRYDPGLVPEFVKMIEERGVAEAVERHVQESARELTVLAEITPQFSTLLDIKQLLERSLATLERHWPGSMLHIFLHEERTDELAARASAGVSGGVPAARLLSRRGLARWSFDHREPVLVEDARNDPRASAADEHRSLMVVPLAAEGRAIGVLAVGNARQGVFGQRDLTLLQAVAAQIGAAVAVADLHERLKRAANTDALTGLHNYRYFYDRLEEEMSRAERRGAPLSIAYFDIDGLKRVNDAYGHLTGDAVLRTLGSAVESSLRHEDVPARYGGDEFAIVMPETDREAAEGAMHRLMERLDGATIEIPGGSTIPMPRRSWGVASYPGDGTSAKELVEAADGRAYARKRAKA